MHAVTALHAVPATKKFEVTCSSCNLREMCLPAGLCAEDLERIENVVYARLRTTRGESLFNSGDGFSAVYAIRSGFFKTSLLDPDGREQLPAHEEARSEEHTSELQSHHDLVC